MFESLEPFLPFRADLAGGLICSVIANVNKAKTVPSFSALDFMPFAQRAQKMEEEKELKKQTVGAVDDVEVSLQMAVLRFGGRVRG